MPNPYKCAWKPLDPRIILEAALDKLAPVCTDSMQSGLTICPRCVLYHALDHLQDSARIDAAKLEGAKILKTWRRWPSSVPE